MSRLGLGSSLQYADSFFRNLIFFKCAKSWPKLSCREFTRPVFVKLFHLIIVFLDHSTTVQAWLFVFSSLICCNRQSRQKITWLVMIRFLRLYCCMSISNTTNYHNMVSPSTTTLPHVHSIHQQPNQVQDQSWTSKISITLKSPDWRISWFAALRVLISEFRKSGFAGIWNNAAPAKN